jgi:DNA-directed RNA polymerase specialized sigma subunit
MTEELEELRSIKKLLILLLKANDVDQNDVARVLGITPGRVSQLLNPKGERSDQEND